MFAKTRFCTVFLHGVNNCDSPTSCAVITGKARIHPVLITMTSQDDKKRKENRDNNKTQ